MEHVLFLYYVIAFCIGFSSLLITILLYLRYRIDVLKYYILLLLLITLDVTAIIASFYQHRVLYISADSWLKTLHNYFFLIALGLVIYSLFLILQRYLGKNLSRLKKAVIGILIFTTPQLVFSSSVVREGIERIDPIDPGFSVLSIITFIWVLLVFILLIRRLKKDSISKDLALKAVSFGLASLLLFMSIDFFTVMFQSATVLKQTAISFTITGYFILSGVNLALIIAHYGCRYSAPLNTAPALYLLEGSGISRREREIIALIVKGYSNLEIAEALFISLSTVKSHVYSIFQKTGVKSRIQLLKLMHTISPSV